MPITNLTGGLSSHHYYGKSGTLVWEGMDNLRANLRSIAEKYPHDLGNALRDPVATDIMTESLRVCPYDQDNEHKDNTPHLNDTAQIIGPEFDENNAPVVFLSYDTPYAVIQHEVQEYHHDIPEQWKYLEHPLNAAALTMAAKLIRHTAIEKSMREGKDPGRERVLNILQSGEESQPRTQQELLDLLRSDVE